MEAGQVGDATNWSDLTRPLRFFFAQHAALTSYPRPYPSDLTDEQREARATEKEKVRAVRRRQKQLEKRIRQKSEL